MQQATLPLPGTLRAGAVAGLIGAVTIDAYLLLMFVVLGHIATLTGFYQFVASGAVGKSAFASQSAAWLGVAVHVAVSVGWGMGYAYVAARMPQVRAQPLVSGVVFGIVVLIAMTLIEVAGAIWTIPTPNAFAHLFFAHTLFFGLPIAYTVSRELRA